MALAAEAPVADSLGRIQYNLRGCKMRMVYIVLIVATAASVVRAEDKPEPDIAAFKMGKVSLETKLEDFKNLYPTARKDKESDAKLGTEVYIVEAEGMSLLGVKFLDGVLYEVKGFWLKKELGKIGGYETILEKIKNKYGKAHEDSPGIKSEKPIDAVLIWKNEADTKLLAFSLKEDHACVEVLNTELRDKFKERKKKSAKSGIGD